jgi:hypothetical protein
MGQFRFKLLDADGATVKEWEQDNSVTFNGLDDMLNVNFIGSSQERWQIGLIAGPIDAEQLTLEDTMLSSNWSEMTYYVGLRPAWVPGPPVAGYVADPTSTLTEPPFVPVVTVSNPQPVTFSLTAEGQLAGAFVLSGSPAEPGSPAGILFSTALFETPVSFTAGQTIQVTYQVSCFPY